MAEWLLSYAFLLATYLEFSFVLGIEKYIPLTLNLVKFLLLPIVLLIG
jgi:hypothetical protein